MDRQALAARLRRLSLRLVRQALDVFAAVTGFYYSKKFALFAGRLAQQRPGHASPQRGFVAIEIDGLSHSRLLRAVEAGHMPYLAGQVRRGRLLLSRWRCGLPSTTPASQAGILFGNNYDIPGFRWYEKETALSVVCKLPTMAKAVQDRIARDQPGLLQGGSSYFNMFDGHASSSLLTLSALNRQHLFASSRGMGFFLLFALNPFRTLRLLLYSVWEYGSNLTQRIQRRLQGEPGLAFPGVFPLMHVATNVVFREVQTFAVLVDIYRGVPSIYTTYYGYDETAHHDGYDSGPTRHVLREMDRRIRQIDRLRRARLSRDYDLIVLADHGQTPSEPFSQRYGQTLGQFIRGCLGSGLILQEQTSDEQQCVFQAQFLLQEIEGIEGQLAEPLAAIARRVRELVAERARVSEEQPTWDLERRSDVVVRNSGSLAHVYFNVSPARLRISEITALFPDLVVTLSSHPGIWVVVGVEGDDVLIFSRDGILTLRHGQIVSAEGSDPLRDLPEPELAREDVATLASYPHSGDLILLGRYDLETDTVVCFEEQWSSHGGLGGPQNYPFIAHPPQLGWKVSQVRNACQLYALFAKAYLQQPVNTSEPAPEPLGSAGADPFSL